MLFLSLFLTTVRTTIQGTQIQSYPTLLSIPYLYTTPFDLIGLFFVTAVFSHYYISIFCTRIFAGCCLSQWRRNATTCLGSISVTMSVMTSCSGKTYFSPLPPLWIRVLLPSFLQLLFAPLLSQHLLSQLLKSLGFCLFLVIRGQPVQLLPFPLPLLLLLGGRGGRGGAGRSCGRCTVPSRCVQLQCCGWEPAFQNSS